MRLPLGTIALLICILPILGACNTAPNPPSVFSLARLKPNKNNAVEVTKSLHILLNNQQITVADDVFQLESRLLLERAQHLDSQGLLLQGRSMESPKVVLLEIQGNQCYLRLEGNHNRVVVEGVICRGI